MHDRKLAMDFRDDLIEESESVVKEGRPNGGKRNRDVLRNAIFPTRQRCEAARSMVTQSANPL